MKSHLAHGLNGLYTKKGTYCRSYIWKRRKTVYHVIEARQTMKHVQSVESAIFPSRVEVLTLPYMVWRVWLTEILETFQRVFRFEKSRIKKTVVTSFQILSSNLCIRGFFFIWYVVYTFFQRCNWGYFNGLLNLLAVATVWILINFLTQFL